MYMRKAVIIWYQTEAKYH